MNIRYRIQQNPNPEPGQEAKGAHIRAITEGAVSTERLCEEISLQCTLTGTDVKSVLDALKGQILLHLSRNNTVHLDGLGTFSLSVKGKIVAENKRKHLIVKDPRVRSVLFRPERQLIDYFANAHFKHGTYLPGQKIDEAYINEKLTEFFAEKSSLRISELRTLLTLNIYDARKLLAKFLDEGALKREGRKGSSVYIPLPGHFGK